MFISVLATPSAIRRDRVSVTETSLRMKVNFPDKLRFLFTDSRYKVIVGGRGKGASWGIARALLLLAGNRCLRVLCTREVQKSIKESVHQLLSEQIELMDMHDVYEVLDNEIRNTQTGSTFIFAGLLGHTVSSLKSYESIDICHVAEAQAVKKKSWDVLIPTIRKPGSEIWIDMNPELDTDDSYVRFVEHAPPDSQVVDMTYLDNPWFPAELEMERAYCEKMYPDDYENIWLGKPRTTVPGAIFSREVLAMIKDNRYTFAPYDPRLKVHTFWDMGWNDACAVILVQQQYKEARIIQYYEDSFLRTDEWATKLNDLKLNWGWDYLPPDAFSKERKTGSSDAEILTAMNRRVKPKHLSFSESDPEFAIRATRNLFPKLILNKGGEGVARLWEVMKHYRRNIPKSTNEPATPVHDEYSHGAAALKGLALMVDKLSNDDLPPVPKGRGFVPRDRAMGTL
ncbi:MAG: PBSX family phage terminase large subunit [Gemmatimonadales bacterium]